MLNCRSENLFATDNRDSKREPGGESNHIIWFYSRVFVTDSVMSQSRYSRCARRLGCGLVTGQLLFHCASKNMADSGSSKLVADLHTMHNGVQVMMYKYEDIADKRIWVWIHKASAISVDLDTFRGPWVLRAVSKTTQKIIYQTRPALKVESCWKTQAVSQTL